MRVLFALSDAFLIEPMGVMQLSAVLRRAGHETRLWVLRRHDGRHLLQRFAPDMVAYSMMTPEAPLFRRADRIVQGWARATGRRPLRIMGGPATLGRPELVDDFGLDALCVGEGDHAIATLVARAAQGESWSGIPNILRPGDDPAAMRKELIQDLDTLPFVDRDLYYEALPFNRSVRVRSFLVGRGCPYHCSYCQNPAFNARFRGAGPVRRRRSVDSVIEEIRTVMERYPGARLVKFADDTFAHRVDPWLEELLGRYRAEIGVPFYCMMRSNVFTEDMARLLAESGCRSIGMAIESGDEAIRNGILRRGLSDEQVESSFARARRHGIRVFSWTLLGLPGTTPEDDLQSFRFTRSVHPTVASHIIYQPVPGTELTQRAQEAGEFPAALDDDIGFGRRSALTSWSDEEKERQLRLTYLAPLFCDLPDRAQPLLERLLALPLTPLYQTVGSAYFIGKTGLNVFPHIYPRTPLGFARLFGQSVRYFVPGLRRGL